MSLLPPWSHHRYVPTVATLITDEAHLSCNENSLTLEQMLNAFAIYPDNTIPFRSAHRSYMLSTYSIRFARGNLMGHDLSDMSLFDDNLYATMNRQHQTNTKIEEKKYQRLGKSSSIHGTRWYRDFREVLEEGTWGTEFTSLECPTVLMLVVSSTESSGDILACFEELRSSRHLPLPYQRGHFDPSSVSFLYILLHDVCKAARMGVDHNILLSMMRSVYPSGLCRLLVINDLPPECANMSQPDLWAEVCSRGGMSPAQHGVRGRYLSPDCLAELHKFVQTIAIKDVLPAMERRISTLNTTVTSLRKGVKNVLKSWWRKPGGDLGTGGGAEGVSGVFKKAEGSVLYPYDRIQNQIRLLADSAFIMQDYELAYSMYRMARDDLKMDKAWLHMGAACEGAALCATLLDRIEGAHKRDPEGLFMAALEAYHRVPPFETSTARNAGVGPKWNPVAARLASRMVLFKMDIQYQGLLGEKLGEGGGADMALRASARDNALVAGVLLEAAGWQQMRLSGPRRFAFYCIMAGDLYAAAKNSKGSRDLISYAARCYGTALGVYEGVGKGWSAIEAHVYSSLASHISALGEYSDAIQLLLILLSRTYSSGSCSSFYDEGNNISSMQRQDQAHLVEMLGQLCRDRSSVRAAALGWSEVYKEGVSPEFSWASIMHKPDLLAQPIRSYDDFSMHNKEMDLIDFIGGSSDSEYLDQDIAFPGLNLPCLATDLVQILPDGVEMSEYMNPSTMISGTESWVSLAKIGLAAEFSVEEAVKRGEGGWLDLSVKGEYEGRAKSKKGSEARPLWRATEEQILVRVVFINPLCVALNLEELQLMIEFKQCESPEGLPFPSFNSESLTDSASQTYVISSEEMNKYDRTGVLESLSSSTDVLLEGMKLTLKPQEKHTLFLRVCPLRKGLLSIVGLKWKLPDMGGIWAVRLVQRTGPLLQDTQEHRANRTRAPDTSLTVAIVGAMPRLECTVDEIFPTLLQGEVIKTRITLLNRGRAIAGDVCLKSTLPWITIHDEKESVPINAPMGCMIGASSTVFRLPLPGGTLRPGESCHIPLSIRGRGSGRHTLGILVRYKRSDIYEDSSIKKFERFIPLKIDVCTLPSLSVSASVLPSYSGPHEYIVSVEVTNFIAGSSSVPLFESSRVTEKNDKDVVVNGVYAISRYWRMEPLAKVNSVNQEGMEGEECCWQERLTMHFRLYPAFDVSRTSREVDPIIQSPHRGINGGHDPSLPLICGEAAMVLLAQANAWHKQRLAAEKSNSGKDEHPATIQEIRRKNNLQKSIEMLKRAEEEQFSTWHQADHPHPASLSALCPIGLSLLNMVVVWGASGGRRGQHHIRGLVIRPQNADTQCPLVLTMEYPHNVSWESHGGFPEIPVNVCVTNRLHNPDASINFSFEVRPDDGPHKLNGLEQNQSKPHVERFVWIGPTRGTVRNLKPGHTQNIPLRILFLHPGIFDINRIRFVIEFPKGPVTFVFPTQYIVEISRDEIAVNVCKAVDSSWTNQNSKKILNSSSVQDGSTLSTETIKNKGIEELDWLADFSSTMPCSGKDPFLDSDNTVWQPYTEAESMLDFEIPKERQG